MEDNGGLASNFFILSDVIVIIQFHEPNTGTDIPRRINTTAWTSSQDRAYSCQEHCSPLFGKVQWQIADTGL